MDGGVSGGEASGALALHARHVGHDQSRQTVDQVRHRHHYWIDAFVEMRVQKGEKHEMIEYN